MFLKQVLPIVLLSPFIIPIVSAYYDITSTSNVNITSRAAEDIKRVFPKRELSDEMYNTLAIAHASIGSIAALIIFPVGVIFARPLRILMQRWWMLHALVNGVFGFGLLVVCFVLAIAMIAPGPHFEAGDPNNHRFTGLILVILVTLQVAGGTAIKKMAKSKLQDPYASTAVKGHPLTNIIHMAMGFAILGLGFYQTWSGFFLIDETGFGLTTPMSVYILWGAVVGITVWSLALSLFAIPMQLDKEAERRNRATGGKTISVNGNIYDTRSDQRNNNNNTKNSYLGSFHQDNNQITKSMPVAYGNGVMNASNNPTMVDDSRTNLVERPMRL